MTGQGNDATAMADAPDDEDAQYATLNESEPGDVEYMFAQTAAGMGINLDGRITLQGVSSTTL